MIPRKSPVTQASSVAVVRAVRSVDPFWDALRSDLPRLLSQIRRLGAPEEDEEDLLHETVIRVLRARDAYDGSVTVGAFAFGFAVRVVANARRRQRRRARLHTVGDPLLPTTERDASTRVEDEQRARRALGRLSFNHRAILVAVDIDQMSVQELSRALGVNPNTLYSRHREARAAFRAALHAVDQDPLR
ncbi:MAG: sigma-70 family RNA polymerase sigma factor [Polyangiaceae bacterium]|nr:sigma-70 family RNA polymerase sigma factor [Polyangiaceae bacterium]MCB9610271.1 sigma-70 family RNA polymerase sigma factor [Polyangiaceae bacterium]